jgi:hypothetical protein
MKTLRPSKEKADIQDFEEEIRRRGEWDARLRNVARQSAKDGIGDAAKWAALLTGIGGLVFWWKTKKKSEPTFAGEDPIVTTALSLGLKVR